MLFIAAGYYYMNRADPDCGTSFTWVSKAMGRGSAGSPDGRSCGGHRRHGDARVHRRRLFVSAFGPTAAAANLLDVSIVAAVWIGHDLDLGSSASSCRRASSMSC